MKDKILPILLSSSLLMSCATYKNGQTPDDVYYSPTKEVSYKEEQREEKYEEDMSKRDEQYLQMKVKDRYRWSTIDDYDYWYDSRYDHCNCSCKTTYNTAYRYNPKGYYYSGGVWYNPSYPIVYYKNPKTYTGTTGKTNITAFSNPRYSNSNTTYNPKTGSSSGSTSNSLLKKVFSNSNNSSNNNSSSSWDRPVRTFPSGSSGSSSGSSSAGGRSGGTDSKGSSASGGRSKGN